jgi:DNA-3-methyladenine glycosylase
MSPLDQAFFSRDACELAKDLLGKIIRRRYQDLWLSAQIIETEAYYQHEKGSHASLGFTEKRKALFMMPGTIYMYYARGGDSLNISSLGPGNAVLIKSARVFTDQYSSKKSVSMMQQLNPLPSGQIRPINKLCSGQTLLCRSLNIKVPEWDQQQFDPDEFYLDDINANPEKLIQTTRLGIPAGRDEHLLYRYISYEYRNSCTSNPLTKRKPIPEYQIIINSKKSRL